MSVIAFTSSKGGVGQTTLVANLAMVLASLGRKVVAVDLCPQNSLKYHLGLGVEHVLGWTTHVLGHSDTITPHVIQENLLAYPFGHLSHADETRLENALLERPEFLGNWLGAMTNNPDVICLLDVPSQPTWVWSLAVQHANLMVSVLLADAASYLTLPSLKARIRQWNSIHQRQVPHGLVLNQVSSLKELSEDVLMAVRADPHNHVLGTIALDYAMGEALAHRTTVYSSAPQSQAFKDLVSLSNRLLEGV